MRRRVFVRSFVASAALAPLARAGLAPARLPPTGPDAEGPFYPTEPIPLDDRLIVDEPFAGDALDFAGRVLRPDGEPLAGVRVEIWQCDANSVYRHPRAPDPSRADPAFRGFGATMSDARGGYAFETIVPVPYPGRPPHIHAMLHRDGRRLLTTQVYLEGFGGAAERKMRLANDGASGFTTRFDFVVVP